ncbi:MAG: ATP-binding cassette domain-containing protein [Lautropia sp.]
MNPDAVQIGAAPVMRPPRTHLWWWCLALVAAVLPFTGISSRWIHFIALIGINTLLAQSMNIVGGFAGQVSLGHAGIFAAGAYGSAVLSAKLMWPLWLSIPAGVALAALAGLLIALPAGRVREFYLGMVTLAFGIIAFEILLYWAPVTGGTMGLSNVPSPVLGTFKLFGVAINLKWFCVGVILLLALATLLKSNLIRSRFGRSFVAVEGSDLAAAALGIHPGRTKRLAYVVSAVWAGLAGALYAHLTAFISPESFNLWASVSILVMAVFGGMRTLLGPFLGAAFLTLLPEMTQGLENYQLLAYGLILLVSYTLLPQGLAGLLRTRVGYIRSGLRPVDGGPASPAGGARGEPQPTSDRPDTALAATGIVKRFGGLVALNRVAIKVRRGSIHGLIGPNGSGKSTLVNVLTGLYAADQGAVYCEGKQITGTPNHAMVGKGVARTFQNPLMFPGMSVRESVLTGADARFKTDLWTTFVAGKSGQREEGRLAAEADTIIDQVGLADWRDELATTLPYGQKRMLDLARALAAKPRILILDEPAAGLSERELEQLSRLLNRLRAEGVTVLLIEHHLDFLFNLVDEVTVLDHGTVIFNGKPDDARRHPAVIEAYLGNFDDA